MGSWEEDLVADDPTPRGIEEAGGETRGEVSLVYVGGLSFAATMLIYWAQHRNLYSQKPVNERSNDSYTMHP